MILISQLLLLKCVLKSAFHAELSLSGFILDENIDMLGRQFITLEGHSNVSCSWNLNLQFFKRWSVSEVQMSLRVLVTSDCELS